MLNWLIAGTDAHAKNYSVLIAPQGRVRLAPLYDIASVLPYPRFDLHKVKLAMKVGDLSKLVGDSVAAVDSFAREKKLKIRYEEQVNVTTWETHLDSRRLKQAFIAVLDNAVKFSQEGGEVLVALEYESGIYRLTVADAGIGMPKELAERLGEPLARGTSMYNFDYEGIGLGLYIAKEVIRSIGGAIAIESKLKKGTTVRIEFPNQ